MATAAKNKVSAKPKKKTNPKPRSSASAKRRRTKMWDVTISSSPPPNFNETLDQKVTGNCSDVPLCRIVGITVTFNLALNVDYDVITGDYTVNIPGDTLDDDQLYVIVVYTTSESASVTLDTRPSGH